MGQGKSKPIRVVVNDNTVVANNLEQTNVDSDDVNNNKDTLGVATEEGNYPAAKPPPYSTKSKHSDNKQRPDKLAVVDETTSIDDDQLSKIKAMHVPVGASFQKMVRQKKEPDPLDVAYPETPHIIRSEPYSHDFGDPRWLSRPASKSLTLSRTELKAADTRIGRLHSSKKDIMFAERLRHEMRVVQSIVTRDTSIAPHKGQVRRFNFEAAMNLHNHFQNIEDTLAEEAAEKHKDHRAETYESLVDDLTGQFQTESLKVKTILAWISKQGIGNFQFTTVPPPDTPNGYMRLIQDDLGTYPVFFALLCRAAGIKCAIVNGISKGSSYEVGMIETSGLRNSWNAVFVDGSWQLVHPLWVCKGIARQKQTALISLERDSERESSAHEQTMAVQSFNHYFIFTNPTEFVYRNLPDEEKWQLLEKPISEDDFLEKSYKRPPFFQNNLTLLSEDKCVLESNSGDPVRIKIGFKRSKLSDVTFGYHLCAYLDKSIENNMQENTEVDETVEKKYVLVDKEGSCVTFEVRFNHPGVYKMKLYGGLYSEYGNNPPWIMDVKLVCKDVHDWSIPLPLEPPLVGWGPGPSTQQLGFYVPSHIGSVIFVSKSEPEYMYFVLQQPADVIIELLHNSRSSDELSQFVNCEIETKNGVFLLKTVITCPGNGEFALRMDVKVGNRLVNVCNYVIHTRKERQHEPYYRRKARGMILDAMKECDLPVLEKALDACERFDLPNTDPDVIGARMRHEFLSCKKELHVALLVNRIDVSEHALYATRNANLDVLFAKEIRKVEAHLKFLMQLDEGGWTVDIPDIDRQTLVELSQLRSPKIEIRLVLVAMYMLLGIDESYLRNWKNVQRLLRDQQSTLVEMARLEKYIEMDEDNCQPVIDVYTVERVNAIIGYYSEDQIRKVDNTLSVYFRWISGILQTTKDMYKERNIIIGDPDLESRVLSSILITPTSTPSKKLQQEQSQVPGTSKKNTNVPTEVPKKKIHTANRKQSSRLVASSSGKVLYRTHKESLNENEDLHNNVNRQSSAVSDDFFDEEDKASRKYLKVNSRQSTAYPTPTSTALSERREHSRLLTAKLSNRVLTARASALNERGAPSRFLATPGYRESNHDLTSVIERSTSISDRRQLRQSLKSSWQGRRTGNSCSGHENYDVLQLVQNNGLQLNRSQSNRTLDEAEPSNDTRKEMGLKSSFSQRESRISQRSKVVSAKSNTRVVENKNIARTGTVTLDRN
ncbi:uncharacterized protein LOC128228646 [Mya arenaria]|uniref:uncharacterized protein LOC128228646 n=1 Tax=Mya arenaria TaxID=6604 RepID=UPI0022E0CAEE|nr:uncharacterized protein LOC128228646 [Mya arenaria]